jgi:NTE family protein
MASERKIGLVLAGGGSRGAYEAGVLSVLLPELERRGQEVTVFVGTSVGALSSAFLAGVGPDRSADALTEGALEVWREIRADQVFRRPLTQLPRTVVELAVPGLRARSLLDAEPLEKTLDKVINFKQLHRNVGRGLIESVSVVATAARDGRSVVFLDSSAEPPDDDETLRYVPTALANVHVRASAAIPILFPPVEVQMRGVEGVSGWYYDGGTRLNTPIKPALDQRVDHVIVIALDSIDAPEARGDGAPPSFGDAVLHLLDGVLVDPLIDDVRTLARTNRLVEKAAGTVRSPDGKAYRTIPYIFICPERRGAIGDLAASVFRERYGGWHALRSPELLTLMYLLGGAGPSQGALLSLLFFDRVFIEGLIEMGERDALRWIDAADGDDAPWYEGPLETRPGALIPPAAAAPGPRSSGAADDARDPRASTSSRARTGASAPGPAAAGSRTRRRAQPRPGPGRTA